MKYDLGLLVAEYQGRPISRRAKFLFYFPASLVSLALLAYGMWQYYYGFLYFGPIAALSWSQSWLLFASATAILTLIGLLLHLSVARRYVAVHENGIQIRFSFLTKRNFLWRSIKGVAAGTVRENLFGFRTRDRYHFRLILNNRRPIIIHQRVENTRALADKIKTLIYPRLLPELKQQFQANQWLLFGRISISKTGIKIQRKVVPWERVSDISVQAGFLVVELQPSGRLRLAISDIYNLELLLHIIHEHVWP